MRAFARFPFSRQAVDTITKATRQGTERLRLRDAAHPAFLRHEPHPRGDGRRAPWQPRDLRRTAATIVARLGADPFVVALVLGHSTTDARVPGVADVYLRWKYDDRVREALDRLGVWVEETVNADGAPGAVVRSSGGELLAQADLGLVVCSWPRTRALGRSGRRPR